MVVKRLLDGRFQFIRVVSTKSYSKTYLMTDQNDPEQSKCIVKHLRLPTSNPVTLKFLTDLLGKRVQLLHRLGPHDSLAKNLANIYDGQDFYWVREYVSGQPLALELADQKPSPEEAVRRFLGETLHILDNIQTRGVVHQNLHPNNLIRHRSDGRLVLVDFGLAQETGTTHPAADANNLSLEANGSSAYLPQMQSRQYPRFNADHFALGMIALQMATGLSTEALPQLQQANFLAQVKLQLDECSTLGEPLKQVLLRMISPQAQTQFHRAKDILALLESSSENPTAPQSATPADATLAGVTPPPPAPSMAALAWGDIQRPGVWLGLGAVSLLLLGGLLWLRTPSGPGANRLLAQAQEASQAGRSAEALGYIDQAIQLSPKNGEALALRANWLAQNGQIDRALQDLTDALQTKPVQATWYFQRGNLRFQVGDLQGAIADYTSALEQDDTYSDAYINRGNARAELGDEAGAVEDYGTALNLATDAEAKADAYLNRCLSLSNLGDQAAALADCTEAVNLRPNNSLAYENRGLVKRRLKDYQGAIQDFTIAIQIDPSSPEAYYNRGLTRQDLDDLSGAMGDFNQTINLNENHPFAYYDRGLLHAELGERELAIADLEVVASACLDVGRKGCFDDAQYQLNKLRDPALN
ncbi:MAG: tetratricopeptide repeat protein [Nodosilinea sp.]